MPPKRIALKAGFSKGLTGELALVLFVELEGCGVWRDDSGEDLELPSLLASAAASPDWKLREAEWNRRHCDRHVTAAGYAESMCGLRHIWRGKKHVGQSASCSKAMASHESATHPPQGSSLHHARTLKASSRLVLSCLVLSRCSSSVHWGLIDC